MNWGFGVLGFWEYLRILARVITLVNNVGHRLSFIDGDESLLSSGSFYHFVLFVSEILFNLRFLYVDFRYLFLKSIERRIQAF